MLMGYFIRMYTNVIILYQLAIEHAILMSIPSLTIMHEQRKNIYIATNKCLPYLIKDALCF